MAIRVLLVDDHHMLRRAVAVILDGLDDVEVVGEAADGQTGVRLAIELRADVVVMDVRLPDISGIAATAQLRAALPDAKIILASVQADHWTLSAALEAGVSGFVPKESLADELADAVRTASRGESYASPSLRRLILGP